MVNGKPNKPVMLSCSWWPPSFDRTSTASDPRLGTKQSYGNATDISLGTQRFNERCCHIPRDEQKYDNGNIPMCSSIPDSRVIPKIIRECKPRCKNAAEGLSKMSLDMPSELCTH